jgi:hypothetical protein
MLQGCQEHMECELCEPMDNIQNHFNLPFMAYEQYCDLIILLQSLLADGWNDVWSYIWSNGEYSVKKAYNHFMGTARCNTPNNNNRFEGITTLQDNNKIKTIEI